MKTVLRIALIVAVFAPVAHVQAAGTGAKCASTKQKAAGKKAAADLSCSS
jgi:hypothetical protein